MPLLRVSLLRVILLVVSALLIASCRYQGLESGEAPRPESVEEMTEEDQKLQMIQVRLTASLLSLPISEVGKLQIGISAVNLGDETIDPQLHRARLSINGQDSLAWNDTISNGRREDKWFALPPGETVSMTWSTIGRFLFPEPGEYTLVLEYAGQESEPILVQVFAE